MISDREAMGVAIEAAARVLGTTRPNPSVGACVVRDGVVLGVGATCPAGGPHAEVMALRAVAGAGHDPRGATMYVTFEPCCHHGRTPPCTDAILAAGLARVIVGVVDPYPPMQGKSLTLLRNAGVEVELGVAAEACAELVRGFVGATTRGMPEVSLKAAISLDGRIATASGDSMWITGGPARDDVQRLRATHDAVLVGSGTIAADNPRLTARFAGGTPVPVVLDTHLRTPPDAAVLRGPVRAILIAAEDAPELDLPADIIRVPRADGGVAVQAALQALAARGLHRVLVEGGGRVHASMLAADAVDHVVLYVAGTVIPGGRTWLAGTPLGALRDAPRWGAPEIAALGDDVRLRYTIRPAERT